MICIISRHWKGMGMEARSARVWLKKTAANGETLGFLGYAVGSRRSDLVEREANINSAQKESWKIRPCSAMMKVK